MNTSLILGFFIHDIYKNFKVPTETIGTHILARLSLLSQELLQAEWRSLVGHVTAMAVAVTWQQILSLLEFCLNTTYFVYKGEFYKQTHGAAMGSPVSPIVANLYIEDFETRALATAPNPPHMWSRYVDDTFVLIHEYFIEGFTNHINSIDPNIKFTNEPEVNFKIPFLDTCVKINDDATTSVEIYRKSTHTDQYLNFQSNHHLEHKRSVVRTLLNRAHNLVTTPEDQARECKHVKAVLKDNGYKPWVFKLPRPKVSRLMTQTVEWVQKTQSASPMWEDCQKNLK